MVERHLAKVNVAGSNLVSRSKKFFRTVFLWRYSQVVRPRSAKPLSPGSNPGGASKNPIFCGNFSEFSQDIGCFLRFRHRLGCNLGCNLSGVIHFLCTIIPLKYDKKENEVVFFEKV